MIKGIPIEQGRVECDPNDVESYFDELARFIDGKPAAFIFNLNESDFQAWADKRLRHVTVPVCYQSDKILIPGWHSETLFLFALLEMAPISDHC
jgi:hypothetical protein